jgi:hypothetical protein
MRDIYGKPYKWLLYVKFAIIKLILPPEKQYHVRFVRLNRAEHAVKLM